MWGLGTVPAYSPACHCPYLHPVRSTARLTVYCVQCAVYTLGTLGADWPEIQRTQGIRIRHPRHPGPLQQPKRTESWGSWGNLPRASVSTLLTCRLCSVLPCSHSSYHQQSHSDELLVPMMVVSHKRTRSGWYHLPRSGILPPPARQRPFFIG